MTPDPATRAREKADSLVTEWLDRWRGWVSLLKREAFVDLVDRIAAALTEPGRGPATGPDVARLREAVKTCEEILQMALQSLDTFAFRTARERVAMVQEELARILDAPERDQAGSEAPASRGPDGPDVERLREALSALVNACEDAFETPEEAADWARTGDMRGYLDTALAALRAPGPAGSATPDGPDGEKR